MSTTKPQKVTKAAFVRSLPISMSAADVVKKAKEAGITLTDKHVWAIRSESRTKKAKTGGAKKSAAAKKAAAPAAAIGTSAKKSAGGAVKSKAGFVRSLPTTLSAKEVVAKGKAAGVKLSEAYVYAIRSAAKKGKKSSGRGPGRPPGSGKKVVTTSGGGNETTFRKLVLEIGVDRARTIVADVGRKWDALIAGL